MYFDKLNTIVIKIGSSLIIDEKKKIRSKWLDSFVKDIQGFKKAEIKKIKIQASEKKEYKVKDYVVYPKHGVGQITEFKKINIGGIDVETYILKFEKYFKENL